MTTSIGRYQIEGELGRGAMGVVYRAHDPLLYRTIALKTILTPEGLADDLVQQFEARFFTEGRAAARLSHPAIVIVHDIGRDPATGLLYMALEHLQGETLAQRTAGGRTLPWREAVGVVATIADALHHAARMGVVHRDVKPANVMLLESGQPKIMDFGIAMIQTARLRLTGSGETMGTPLYMSPEQALGEDADHRGDVFSLGATLYRALTGTDAFAAQNMAAIIQRVVRDEPEPPSSVNPALPASVDLVVAKALAKAPETRYADAKALAEDLEDVAQGRPPRHAMGRTPATPADAGEDELLAELIPTKVSPPVRPDPPPRPGSAPRAETVPAMPGAGTLLRRVPQGRRWLMPAALLGLVALVGWWRAGPSGPVTPSRDASGERAPATPPLTAVPTTTTPVSATLAIDFEHGLRSGRLRVWVDDDLALEEELDSRVRKKALVFKSRKGGVEQELSVAPGRHAVRVQVAWDDNVKTRTLSATFAPGSTRRLSAQLGGLIKKDLTLEWE